MNEELKNETVGISEVMEALVAIDIVATGGAKIAADKKIDLSDIEHLVGIVKEYNKIKDGVDGIEKALPELKYLDQTEAAMIIAKVFAMSSNFKEALK